MKGIRYFSLLAALTLVISLCLSACASQNGLGEDSSGSLAVSSETVLGASENVPVLTYLAEDDFLPASYTVDGINQYLRECGKEYQINFVGLPFENYDAALEEYLADGKPADLLFTNAPALTQERLMDLTSYLGSDSGASLKSVYSEFGWEQGTVDGKIRVVPSNLIFDQPPCYLVNKNRMEELGLKEEDLQKPLWELLDVLKQAKEHSPREGFFPLLITDASGFCNTNQAYQLCSGISVDRAIREAAYLFDQEDTFSLLNAMYQSAREGLLGTVGSGFSNDCSGAFLDDTFLIYCPTGTSPYEIPDVSLSQGVPAEEGEDYLKIDWLDPTVYCDRMPGGTGISVNSQYPEEALDFLTLMMTDQKLTDFLQHGTEGKEYFLDQDGKVVPNYEEKDSYQDYRCWLFGNRLIATPRTNEYADKKKRAEALFSQGVVTDYAKSWGSVSPTIQQDMAFYDAMREITAVLNPEDSRSLDDIITAARIGMDEAGGQEILAQFEEEK